MVGLTVLLVVSLLTVKSDRRVLVDKVRREVISEGPRDKGGLLHWPRGVVVGFAGFRASISCNFAHPCS